MKLRYWFLLYVVLASFGSFYGWREAQQDAERDVLYAAVNQLSQENAVLAGHILDLDQRALYLSDRTSELYLAYRTGCRSIGRYESVGAVPADFFADPNNYLLIEIEYDVPTQYLQAVGYGYHCTQAVP